MRILWKTSSTFYDNGLAIQLRTVHGQTLGTQTFH